MTPFEFLGVDADAKEAAIRRAYAQRVKHTRPDDDPAGFQALHEAYRVALAITQSRATPTPPVAEPPVAAPIDAEVVEETSLRTAAAVAEEILQTCQPESFDEGALKQRLAQMPELTSLHHRAVTGVWLARHLAKGAVVPERAVAVLADEFGWNDVTVLHSHPIYGDTTFLTRLYPSRPNPVPASPVPAKPANRGIGILVFLILVGAKGALEPLLKGGHAGAWFAHWKLDNFSAGVMASTALIAVLVEVWTAGRALSPRARIGRLIVRIVCGILFCAALAYCLDYGRA